MAHAAKKSGKARTFTAVVEPAEEGGYVVHIPTLAGCVTQGETLEEAKANAKEAIECYLLAQKDMGEELLSEPEGTVVIAVSTDIVLD
jgi:antitoxin HicB